MNVTRAYGYDLTVEIDRRSYQKTYPSGGDVGYAFYWDPDGDTREKLEELTRQQLDAKADVAVESVDVTPGYIRVRARLDGPTRPNLGADTLPKAVRSAVKSVASEWNRRYATPGANGPVDAVRFGDVFMMTYRPDGAQAPPDSDEDPICTVTPDDGHYSSPRTDAGERALWYTGVFPIDPETYDAEIHDANRQTPVSFEWGEYELKQLTEYATAEFAGKDFRLRLYPEYIQVDVQSGSLTRPPEYVVLGGIEEIIRKLNARRRMIEHEDLIQSVRRPELQLHDDAYIGALDAPEDYAEKWIEAKGLDDVDGKAFDPVPGDALDSKQELDTEQETGSLPITDTLSRVLGR